MVLPWWTFSIVANLAVCGIERANRAGAANWGEALIASAPFIVLAQWALYRSFSESPHWLMAAAVFSGGSAVFRVLTVLVFAPQEISSWWVVVAGVGTMVAGGLVLKLGLH